MAGIATAEGLSPQQKVSFDKVCKRFAAADNLHREFTARWDTWYGLSKNWRRLSKSLSQATDAPDKDVIRQDMKREFGQELFIPYCYTVIETTVPRILSRQPRWRARPGEGPNPEIEVARPAMEALYERDAKAMSYERKLQETVRSGLRYGLGVQKQYWDKRTRKGKAVKPLIAGIGRKVVDVEHVVFEGPCVESVDIYDFFWDPAAHDLQSADFVIHRTWRSEEYVAQKVKSGEWLELDLEKINSLASSTGMGEGRQGRMEAAGMSGYQTQGVKQFEIWEYHDRDQVITTLGGKSGLLVQEGPNPFLHGEFPFQIFRPTITEHEFVGTGEVEPIAHLQWELNTLRGQRRDAAALALSRGYFYQAGMLDPEEIVSGAGVFNPVYGPPNEIIQEMPFSDIPQSGISEEQAIKADIELTTAMAESTLGQGTANETATGTQAVQAALNYRTQLKTKNLHVDLIAPETKLKKPLYEQYVVDNKQTQTVRVEDPTVPTGYVFVDVTPEMFGLNIEMEAIDGSTEADDPAQKKHDATELAQTLIPFAAKVNEEQAIKYTLEQHEVENPGDWIKKGPSPEEAASQAGESQAKAIADAMQKSGLPPEQIEGIMQAAHSELEGQQAQQPQGGEAPPQEGGEAPAPAEPEQPPQQGAPE